MAIDALLRAQGRHRIDLPTLPWRRLLAFVAAGGFLYGAAMGCFGLRLLQPLYSGIKVPLLLFVTSVLCLPSFYAVNALLGLRGDFALACRGILVSQAVLAVCLAALSPLTILAYASSSHYPFAQLFNGLPFALATIAGQVALRRHYRPLVRKNPRHTLARRSWAVVYVFVAIQFAWVLRPFVGKPDLPTRFFREGAWSNAYVFVFDLIRGVFR